MITKKAENSNNLRINATYTDAARDGWEIILNSIPNGSKILLPSYIGITEREGSGIYDPVLSTGTKHDFYLLNDDLSIDVDVLKNVISKDDYKLILLVHYFGIKIRNISEIAKICRRNGIIIVEDCAHLYNFGHKQLSNAGSYGDYVFYSLHKFFPVKKGGLVVSNVDTVKLTVNRNKHAENTFKYDVKEIVAKKRGNYEALARKISAIKGLRIIYEDLGVEDIPQSLPVIVEYGMRERLYFWLMERGVPTTALYYRLIEPLNKPRYKTMQQISGSILNLPVHQDITDEDIEKTVDYLRTGIQELRK